jgi:N-acetylmuramic acid 6-phosphate etherase
MTDAGLTAALAALETEGVNPRTTNLDQLNAQELVQILHSENHLVPATLDSVLPQIAEAIEVIANRLQAGGRLFYIGAGTSGRLGVLDASECPPTFSVPSALVQGIIAGGEAALTTSIEGAEDSPEQGASDLRARGVSAADAVVGIAASGRTPYVMGALNYAKSIGAAAIAVANVSAPAIGAEADIIIAAVTGPEPLTGSTRLKAGTAQKLILNLLSTGAMVLLGKTYGNLMVDVRPTNLKLRDRAVRIVEKATGSSRADAEAVLGAAGWQVKPAIVSILLGCSPAEAETLLQISAGRISGALSPRQ